MTSRAGAPPPPAGTRGGAPVFFHLTAAAYDRNLDAPTVYGHCHRARHQMAARLAGPGPGEILEVGFGPGRLLEILERRGWTAWGIDAAPAMIDLARARVPAAAGRLALGDVERLPLPDERFDVVVCAGLLGYVRTATALAELARVLRPGGRAIVTFRRRSPYGLLRDDVYRPLLRAVRRVRLAAAPVPPSRRPARSVDAVTALVARAGLGVEVVECVGCMVLPQIGPPRPRGPAVRGAEAAEARAWARRIFATQAVVAARKAR